MSEDARTKIGVVRGRPKRPSGEVKAALVLATPFFALLGVFTGYPAVRAVIYSFQDFSPLNPSAATFTGITQYATVLKDPIFQSSVLNTLILLAVTLPIQTVLALVIAVALNRRLRMRGFFRAVYFLPYITAPVAVGAIMLYLFGPSGVLTGLLHSLFGTPNSAWYAQKPWALILVAMVMIWTETGFFAVIFLSGLQSINPEVLEAAELDGAGAFARLTRIIVPLLRPTMVFVLTMGTIVALQIFEQPYVLSTTGGALPGSPDGSTSTMVMYVYTQAFRYSNMGPASAAAFIVVVIIVAVSLLQSQMQRRGQDQ